MVGMPIHAQRPRQRQRQLQWHRAAVAAAILLSLFVLPPSVQGYELSCAGSRVPPPSALRFCGPVVSWRAAAVYAHINYTDFRAGARYSDADQDRIASRQYDDLVYGHKEVSAPCGKALQRFVCASAFPECPQEGFDVPHRPVCRPTCREAEAACGLPLSCDFLLQQAATDCTSSSGSSSMEEGFFVLKDDQGPYEPLPYLYGGLLAVWVLLSLAWIDNIFRSRVPPRSSDRDEAPLPTSRLGRLLTCVPLAKVAMMLLSLAFWAGCVRRGHCAFWMGVGLINCQLLYETFSLVGFVLIAKGWCITRPGFHPNEWRTVILLMCSFYLASSSLLLVRRVILSSAVFWLCTGMLYFSAYGYVLLNVRERTKGIRRQLRRALRAEGGGMTRATSPDARFRVDLLLLKQWMYETLSALLTAFCVTELVFCLLPVLHHVDLAFLPEGVKGFWDAVAELDARLWLTLIVHEVVEIAILFMVGFLFRPRLLTAFSHHGLWEEGGMHADGSVIGRGGRSKRALRPPPLYLIPVPAEEYHPPESPVAPTKATTPVEESTTHDGLIIPRKHLSPSDLHFTLSSSAGGGLRRRRRQQQQQQWRQLSSSLSSSPSRGEQDGDESISASAEPASAVGRVVGEVVEQQPAPQPPEAQEHETERLLPPPLPPPSPHDDLSPSVSSSFLSSSSSSSVSEEEAGEENEVHDHEHEDLACVKPAIQYHASRFLVVQLPNGLYAVAVAEEEKAEGGVIGSLET